MATKGKYIIPFSGLKDGEHHFRFEIDGGLFEETEMLTGINSGKLVAEIDMVKQSRLMELDISIKGNVEVVCDRCNEPYTQKIRFTGPLYVKPGEGDSEDDEVLFISEEEYELIIDHYLYESIVLSLPFKKVHPVVGGKSTCNPEILDKLKKYSTNNDENDKGTDTTDPRWDKLKDLLQNKN